MHPKVGLSMKHKKHEHTKLCGEALNMNLFILSSLLTSWAGFAQGRIHRPVILRPVPVPWMPSPCTTYNDCPAGSVCRNKVCQGKY